MTRVTRKMECRMTSRLDHKTHGRSKKRSSAVVSIVTGKATERRTCLYRIFVSFRARYTLTLPIPFLSLSYIQAVEVLKDAFEEGFAQRIDVRM